MQFAPTDLDIAITPQSVTAATKRQVRVRKRGRGRVRKRGRVRGRGRVRDLDIAINPQ
jgi:hypothetical protein